MGWKEEDTLVVHSIHLAVLTAEYGRMVLHIVHSTLLGETLEEEEEGGGG